MKGLAKFALTVAILIWLGVVFHRPADVVLVQAPPAPEVEIVVAIPVPEVVLPAPAPTPLPPKKPVKKSPAVVAPAQKDAPAVKKTSAPPAPVRKQVDMSVLPWSCSTVRYYHDTFSVEHLKTMANVAGVPPLTKAQEVAVAECLRGKD